MCTIPGGDGFFDFRLKSPACMIITSCSGGGKTFLALRIIRNRHKYFDRSPLKVIYVYTHLESALIELARKDSNIILTDSIEEAHKYVEKDALVCIDDKMMSLSDKRVAN